MAVKVFKFTIDPAQIALPKGFFKTMSLSVQASCLPFSQVLFYVFTFLVFFV